MLPSLAKIIGVPTLADTGLKVQHDLLIALRAAGAIATDSRCAVALIGSA